MHRRPRLTLSLLTTALLLAGAALLYTAAVWSFRVDPRPTRDLLAEFNAPWSHIPDHERAAPVYQRLFDAWQALPPPVHPDGYFELIRLRPADPAFPAFAQAARTLEPHLAAAREASKRPALGADFVRAQADDLPPEFAPFDKVMAESAYSIRTPGLIAAITAARLLLIDADAAALDSDAPRAAANLHAALAIARQLREIPLFIADHTAISTTRGAAHRIRRILAEHPDLFTPDTLAALQTDLARTADEAAYRFENERLGITDLLDRTFAPGPSGRITAVGLQRLDRLSTLRAARARVPDESAALAPFQAWTIASRAEHLEAFDQHLAAAMDAQQHGFRGLADFSSIENDLMFDPAIQRRLPVVVMTSPAYSSAIHTEHAMRLEAAATTVALALHRYHAHHAAFPDTLEQLVPTYLTAIPTDPFDLNDGPIKYLRTADSFTLYVNGSNLKDDHATPMPPDPQQQHGSIERFSTDSNGVPYPAPHDADWILHPPQD
jgi:hypothetical protein